MTRTSSYLAVTVFLSVNYTTRNDSRHRIRITPFSSAGCRTGNGGKVSNSSAWVLLSFSPFPVRHSAIENGSRRKSGHERQCAELCKIIPAKVREFLQIFLKRHIGRTEQGTFKHAGIILHNTV